MKHKKNLIWNQFDTEDVDGKIRPCLTSYKCGNLCILAQKPLICHLAQEQLKLWNDSNQT